MAKIQEIVNIATKGSVNEFWDVISGNSATRDLKKQYKNSLSFVDPHVGIPDQFKDAYDRAVKHHSSRLWKKVLKFAASGFGKGLIATAAIVVIGGALLAAAGTTMGLSSIAGISLMTEMPLGAAAAQATVGEAIGAGLTAAGNFLWSAGGVTALAIGGTLGAVSNVRMHQNMLTADLARVEAESFARLREENLAKEIQQMRESMPVTRADNHKKSDIAATLAAQSKQKDSAFTAREMARREADIQNIHRNI
ncbi:MAG: hypothetical protein ACN2B6_02735 [Rickettsiales bacterium]